METQRDGFDIECNCGRLWGIIERVERFVIIWQDEN